MHNLLALNMNKTISLFSTLVMGAVLSVPLSAQDILPRPDQPFRGKIGLRPADRRFLLRRVQTNQRPALRYHFTFLGQHLRYDTADRKAEVGLQCRHHPRIDNQVASLT